jgi:AcrR family transcriptional regulator
MARAPRRYQQTVRAEAATLTAQRVMASAQALLTARWYDDVTLEDIADHAGVSVKTVQRRFGTKDQLAREFFLAAGQENAAYRDAVPAGDVDAALEAIVKMYEADGDNIVRYLALETRIPLVAEVIEGGRLLHRGWVERVFGPLLPASDRRRTVAMLVVATDVYTWKLLRRDAGLSRAATTTCMRDLIGAALAPPKGTP